MYRKRRCELKNGRSAGSADAELKNGKSAGSADAELKNSRSAGSTDAELKIGGKRMAALHLTTENFRKEVLEYEGVAMVDFWASWCGPCQMVGPIIEEIAGEVTDAKICKVDVDENPELAKEYRVMSIPTLMVFKNGEAVKREVGAKPKDEILDMLK